MTKMLVCSALFLASAKAHNAPDWLVSPTTNREPLVDVTCNLEEIDKANTEQLHVLLQELSETTYFRLIRVNMEGKCQYFGAPAEEDEEPACEGTVDDSPVPLCSVGGGDAAASPFGAAAGFGSGGGDSGFSTSDAVDA